MTRVRSPIVLFFAVLVATPLHAQPLSERKPILKQEKVGEVACGPCALYNALNWGDASLAAIPGLLSEASPAEKVLGLIKRYGEKVSEEYGDKPRYHKEGITWNDLLYFTNDFFGDHKQAAAKGDYLDRLKGEKLELHVRRIHKLLRDSLDAGLPPVVSIRSFAAAVKGKDTEYKWYGLHGHWVTFVDVPKALDEGEKGFRFGYIDPATGRVEFGYAYVDEARNFTAAKGTSKKWVWLSDRPFLLITAPSMRLRTQDVPWHDRTTITLNYAVYR